MSDTNANTQALKRILHVIAYGGAALTVAAAAPACGDSDATAEAEPDRPEITPGSLVCPPPDPEQIAGCSPECDIVACYTSDDGRCLDAQTSRGDITERLIQESGRYDYSESVVGLRGPYDTESSHEFTDDTGDCCYIITNRFCTGRPLTCGDGEIRVAPVAERGDWV